MTTVITAYDHNGSQHWCAAESEFLRDGLADGTLTLDPVGKPAIHPPPAPVPTVEDAAEDQVPNPGKEEADDATEDAPQAEAGDTKPRRAPSRQRKSN